LVDSVQSSWSGAVTYSSQVPLTSGELLILALTLVLPQIRCWQRLKASGSFDNLTTARTFHHDLLIVTENPLPVYLTGQLAQGTTTFSENPDSYQGHVTNHHIAA